MVRFVNSSSLAMRKQQPSFVQRLASLRQQEGASLVEVLIAIVIAAFALLGLAGLQVSALRYQKVANYHNQASQFAAEMADRMRAKTGGAREGAYGIPTGSYSAETPTLPQSKACATVGECKRAQSAAQDIFQWRKNLHDNMSGGWGAVAGDVTTGFAIRVYFREGTVDGAAQADAPPDANCPEAKPSDKNVRCFTTVFFP